MVKRQKGQVVAFDGPDGVGKTTQIQRATQFLQKQGFRVLTTRASGGTPIGEALRTVSLSPIERPAETDLYISLAMHTALGKELTRLRSQFDFILIDRSPLAIIAYNVYGSEMEKQTKGLTACRQMLQLWKLDALLLLEAPVSILDARRQHRAGKIDYFEQKGKAYRQRVRKGYQVAADLAEKIRPKVKLIKIEASPSIDQIEDQIIARLLSLIH